MKRQHVCEENGAHHIFETSEFIEGAAADGRRWSWAECPTCGGTGWADMECDVCHAETPDGTGLCEECREEERIEAEMMKEYMEE